MKTQNNFFDKILVATLLALILSCNQDKVDPALALDEVLVPEGYRQIDNPSADALSRLEEMRLNNPEDHFYYLERIDKMVGKSRVWVFPQKELKIEHVDYEQLEDRSVTPQLLGVIVKRIKGNWQNEEFVVFDSQPQPLGGLKEFYKYIQENLAYPQEAKEKGVDGKVFVQFIVYKDGSLKSIRAIKGIGAGCDEEAVRVLKEAPKWIPAKVMEKPVNTRMILPITFKLG